MRLSILVPVLSCAATMSGADVLTVDAPGVVTIAGVAPTATPGVGMVLIGGGELRLAGTLRAADAQVRSLAIEGLPLGSQPGDTTVLSTQRSHDANSTSLRTLAVRKASGSEHDTSETRIQRRVDVTDQGYVGFGSTYTALGIGSTAALRVNADGSVTAHAGLAVIGTATAANVTVGRASQATGAEAVRGDDPRLADARPASGGNADTVGGQLPTSFAAATHAAQHAAAGSDPIHSLGVVSFTAENGVDEGGHVLLKGSGSWHDWNIDAYRDRLRIFDAVASPILMFEIAPGGVLCGGQPLITGNDPRLADARPANGGNADTVDGKHAADLVLAAEKGAANGVATLDASGKVQAAQMPAIGSIPQAMQVFDSSGTFTVPLGVTRVFVEAWGGGGGGGKGLYPGGGNPTGAGGGGGAGGYAAGIANVTPGAAIAVTVGTGGTNAPTAGGSTSFGTAVIAAGGAAGSTSSANEGNGGAGGSGTAGTILMSGAAGGRGVLTSKAIGGDGGGSPRGAPAIAGKAAAGSNGIVPGGGGAGGGNGTAASSVGGAGAAGRIIISW